MARFNSSSLLFLSIFLSWLSSIPNVETYPIPVPEPSILARIGRAFNELTEPITLKKKIRQSKRQFGFPASSYYGPGVIPIAYPNLPSPPPQEARLVQPPRIPYITQPYGPHVPAPQTSSPHPESPIQTLKRVYEIFRDALPISDFQDATDQLNFLLISSAFSAIGELMADMHSLNQIMQQMLHLLGLNNLLGLSPPGNGVARSSSNRRFNLRLIMPQKFRPSRRIKLLGKDSPRL